MAVLPPSEVVDALAAALRRTRAAAPALRWTRPDQWHVTLAFLGPVPDDRRAELDRRLARVAHRHGPIPVVTVGGGRFGERVLWTAVRPADQSGQRARLGALAVGVRRAAERAGVTGLDTKPLRAHLTLARVPDGRTRALRPLVELLDADVPPLAWSVERLTLMSSSGGGGRSGAGPVYRVEAEWELDGEGAGRYR